MTNELEQYADGTIAVSIRLPTPHYGDATIVAQDDTEDSVAMLRELEQHWRELWPALLQMLLDGMESVDCCLILEDQVFEASASRLKSNEFMYEKADTYLSFSFDQPPAWDYFIRGPRIVHFQPVF